MILEKLRVDSGSGFEDTISVSRRELVRSWWKRRRRKRGIAVGLAVSSAVIVMLLVVSWHDAVIGTTSTSDLYLGHVDYGTVVTVKGVLISVYAVGNSLTVQIQDSTGSYVFHFSWAGAVPLNGSYVVLRGTFLGRPMERIVEPVLVYTFRANMFETIWIFP